VGVNSTEWGTLLVERLDLPSILDKRFATRLRAGALRFGANAREMIRFLQSHESLPSHLLIRCGCWPKNRRANWPYVLSDSPRIQNGSW
jgi:hypothetical protein